MTNYIISFGLSLLLIPAIVWLLRRIWLYKRLLPMKYLQHTRIEQMVPFVPTSRDSEIIKSWHLHLQYPGTFGAPKELPSLTGRRSSLLDILRRDRVFPWVVFRERWFVTDSESIRESDGEIERGSMHRRFVAMIEVAEACDVEFNKIVEE